MIKITGDTHGEQDRLWRLTADMSSGDTLIVCGDFGYLYKNDSFENVFLNEMEELEVDICFCDGNHENFDAIEEYPVEIWNGGKVHRIRENIRHLMRGQVFEIEGSKFFTMGGAYSIDRACRIKGLQWWERELPVNEEYDEATRTLEENNFKVDYILSHTAPREIIRRMGYNPVFKESELSGFLEWIMYEAEYKRWFFGHFHEDMTVDGKHRALMFDEVII